MRFDIDPRESLDERDALLAWCINQLGGSIVLEPEDQRRVFDTRWEVRTWKDDRARLIVEATAP